MAMSGAGSPGCVGSEVRKTAEFCETPRSLRSGKRPSASWPRRCCDVADIVHRRDRARGCVRQNVDSETKFRLDAQEKFARRQAGEASWNCEGKKRERKEGCA